MVRDLRRARGEMAGFPKVLFFHSGDVSTGYRFFRRRWPGAHAVADRDRSFRDAFCRRRGRLRQILGARVWPAAWRAARKGCFPGRPAGILRTMPGLILVRDERVIWSHPFEHIGDLPAWKTVAARCLPGSFAPRGCDCAESRTGIG